MKPEHVYLIDGSGFIFRAFYGLPPMSRADGTPVNAVFGFTKMVMKLIRDTDADHLAVIFDTKRKTFRNDIYTEYKANRDAPPDDLIPQFELVRQATDALNIARVEMDGYEADDLIATYARQAVEAGADVTIVTSDKDMMQLVNDKVCIYDAMKNRMIRHDEVIEKFGVAPDKVIDVQSLAGDSSDNIPGIRGIGIKTAALLINEYGDLDTLLERAGEVKQPKRRESLINEADMARVSRELVTLKQDIDTETPLSNFAKAEPDKLTLLTFLHEQAFKTLANQIDSSMSAAAGATDATGATGATGASGSETTSQTAPAPATIEKKYSLVQDIDALQGWIDTIYKHGFVTIDTETNSLDSMQADLVGISLSCVAGEACYIPLAHRKPETQGSLFGEMDDDNNDQADAIIQIPMGDAVSLLKPMLEDPSILKIGQNIKYDIQILARYDMEMVSIDDTMLLSYVLDGGLGTHGMDALASRHLEMETIKFKEVVGSGKSQITFDLVPLDKACDYAAEDADITGRLHALLKPRLVEDRMVTVYETLERKLVPVLDTMERHGILVDRQFLSDLSTDFASRMAALEAEIHQLAGHEFNVGSPKQLGEILFDEMGIEGGKKGKTGAYATGADILEELAANGHELPAKVLSWRQLAKLKSTYTDALIAQINPNTGRVHTSYAQAVAATGRLSSSDPNLQNIPIRTEEGRKIRQAFVPAPGHTFVSADYSQIELRLLAHVAGIDSLKEAFHGGLDIHAMTASQVFGVPLEDMDPMVRRNAKAINFGIIYGISAFGLANQLGISRGEAKGFIEAYFEQYPGIRTYMDDTIAHAKTHGYVETLFGRRCHTPEINNRQPNHRGFAERAAINAPIQGGAADIIKRAMIALDPALVKAELKAKVLLQVHDELVLEVPDAELDATISVLRTVMENAATLDVPLVVDVGTGANWDEAH